MDLREDAASLQELYVACLCGLAYGVADIVRTLERAGYDFDMLVVSGGAGRSPLVRQIIADAAASGRGAGGGRTGAAGSAMIGAVAAGAHASLLRCRRCRRSR